MSCDQIVTFGVEKNQTCDSGYVTLSSVAEFIKTILLFRRKQYTRFWVRKKYLVCQTSLSQHCRVKSMVSRLSHCSVTTLLSLKASQIQICFVEEYLRSQTWDNFWPSQTSNQVINVASWQAMHAVAWCSVQSHWLCSKRAPISTSTMLCFVYTLGCYHKSDGYLVQKTSSSFGVSALHVLFRTIDYGNWCPQTLQESNLHPFLVYNIPQTPKPQSPY